MAIFDEATHEILMKFLDKKAQDAEREITERGTLSEEHAIPLILKSQFNHIAHLDTEITELRGVMDKRFEQITNDMDGRFSQITSDMNGRFSQITSDMNGRFSQITSDMNGRFSEMRRLIAVGVAFLALVMTLLRFIR